MPDYSNEKTRAIEAKLARYYYDFDSEINPRPGLVRRGPFLLDDGSVYKGEWNQDGKREGNGTQIWKDGSKYIG